MDPVVFFKLQLVMFFEDLRSERRLMGVVADRISLRWYLGYDLHEPLPDHSSLTRIRERYGLGVFRRFFERIVELCVEAGLVRGEELFFDSTTVKADAARGSLVPRLEVVGHVEELFEDDPEGESPPVSELPRADAALPTAEGPKLLAANGAHDAPGGQGDQFLDLLQGEPQELRPLDEREACHLLFAVEAVAGLRPARGLRQPLLLVVVEGLHGEAREPGGLSHLQQPSFRIRACPVRHPDPPRSARRPSIGSPASIQSFLPPT